MAPQRENTEAAPGSKALGASSPSSAEKASPDLSTIQSPASDNSKDINSNKSSRSSNDDQKSSKPARASFGPYFRVVRRASLTDHLLRCVGVAAAITFGAAIPLMTILLGNLVDDLNGWGSGNSDTETLLESGTNVARLMAYIFVGTFVCALLSAFCFKYTAVRATSRLRQDFMRALLSQEIEYHDSSSPGAISSLISSNADIVESGLGDRVSMFISGCAMLVGAFIVAFIQSWRLTLVVSLALPVSTVGASFAVIADTKVSVKVMNINARAAGIAEEALSTVKIITAFGANNKIRAKYDMFLEDARRFGAKQGPLRAIQFGFVLFMNYLAYAIALLYGAYLVANGSISSGGKVVIVLNALLLASAALNNIAPSLTEISKASAAAQGLLEVIDRTPLVNSLSKKGKRPTEVAASLALRNVTFKYPSRPSVKVLDDVSIDFEAGKTTAIVGPSGCGKSTLLALITRWFDPDAGLVLMDGLGTKTLNPQWLRSQMGYVQQDPTLFNDTISRNVGHGLARLNEWREGPNFDNRVRDACERAFAHQFICNLPHGYDTIVGDKGDTLSGGQKQRIAIARSIASNPPILLLDEATSALDPEAEKVVQKALDDVSKSRTTIVVTHKLATVKSADKIVVMSSGRVVEQGTHQELMDMNKVYAGLVAVQMQQTQKHPPAALAREATEGEKEKIDDDAQRPSMPDRPSDEVPSRSNQSMLSCLWRVLKSQKRLWPLHAAGMLCSIAGGALFPAQAVLFSKTVVIFQYPLPEQAARLRSDGYFWGSMYVVVAVGVLIFYSGMGYFSTIAACHLAKEYRSAYFASMMHQDAAFFERDDNDAGAMSARLSTNPQRIQDLMSINIAFILVAVVNVVGSSVLSLAVGWRLGLVALFGALLPLIFSGFMRFRLEAINLAQSAKAYRECVSFSSEVIGAMRTVSSLTLESNVLAMYKAKLDMALGQIGRFNLMSSMLVALTDSLYFGAMALVFWYGTRLVARGEYTVETFFIIFIAIIFGGQAAGFMFGLTLHTTKAHGAAVDMFSLLDSKALINSSTGKPLTPASPGTPMISFNNITFAYPSRPSHPALNSLQLSIQRGSHVGIVGASGSGKSTVMALLERFYDPTSGTVLVDGVPLTELDVHAHRARIGYVGQSTTLYDGTLRDNVLFGIGTSPSSEPAGDSDISSSRHAEDKRVETACIAANIHDFVRSLPDGYETEAGTKGVALSGGQRQRIAIARALIREPEILLFDEATSALDSASERTVQAAVEAAARGASLGAESESQDEGNGEKGGSQEKQPRLRTTIVVAHRLSTVRNCDRIFVLSAGMVKEQGTHDELMRRRGRYFEMVMAQALDRDVEAS